MNVASLELCKELYELSDWEPEDWHDPVSGYIMTTEDKLVLDNDNDGDAGLTPAYDLGYLLRKLPTYSEVKSLKGDVPWIASYDNGASTRSFMADNPEDVACKLAIELFKQGVLTKEAA